MMGRSFGWTKRWEKFTARLSRALGLLLIGWSTLATGAAFADELEDRLREAREQLDAAAERLAELNREMYEVEMTEGRYGKRAMLGILLNDADQDRNGIVIEGVTPDGGAEQAGLRAGDRIVAIGGVRLDAGAPETPHQLLSGVLKGLTPGDVVTVEYVRNENLVVADVTTQAKRDYVMKALAMELDGFGPDFSAKLSREFEGLEELKELKALGKLETLHELGDLGELLSSVITIGAPLKLEDMDPDLAAYFGVGEGVLVVSPPAQGSALKAGDILLELDGEPVTSASTALKQLALGEAEVAATVLRRGERQRVAVDCATLSRHNGLAISHGPKRIQIRRGNKGDHDVEVEIHLDDAAPDTEPESAPGAPGPDAGKDGG